MPLTKISDFLRADVEVSVPKNASLKLSILPSAGQVKILLAGGHHNDLHTMAPDTYP